MLQAGKGDLNDGSWACKPVLYKFPCSKRGISAQPFLELFSMLAGGLRAAQGGCEAVSYAQGHSAAHQQL